MLLLSMVLMMVYIINNNTEDCHHGGSAIPWLTNDDEGDDGKVVDIKSVVIVLFDDVMLMLVLLVNLKKKGVKSFPTSNPYYCDKIYFKEPVDTLTEGKTFCQSLCQSNENYFNFQGIDRKKNILIQLAIFFNPLLN